MLHVWQVHSHTLAHMCVLNFYVFRYLLVVLTALLWLLCDFGLHAAFDAGEIRYVYVCMCVVTVTCAGKSKWNWEWELKIWNLKCAQRRKKPHTANNQSRRASLIFCILYECVFVSKLVYGNMRMCLRK